MGTPFLYDVSDAVISALDHGHTPDEIRQVVERNIAQKDLPDDDEDEITRFDVDDHDRDQDWSN